MTKPPIDPDSFDKVNFVIDAWTTGCDAPWYIYIETMKPALLTAFITLITFGFDDVLRGYFRPRGLYKRRTAKRKGKFVRRIPRFPEVGDALGKQLPGATEVKGTKWTTLGKTLWRIDGAMEQIRFYWLVIAIAEDFAFDWTSLLYESYWCLPDAMGRFSFQSPAWDGEPGGRWTLAGFGTMDYMTAPPYWGHTSGGSGPTGCTVATAFAVRRAGTLPPPTGFQVKVVNKGNSKTIFAANQTDLDSAGNGTVLLTGVVPPNIAFNVWTKFDGTSYAERGQGIVMATAIRP